MEGEGGARGTHTETPHTHTDKHTLTARLTHTRPTSHMHTHIYTHTQPARPHTARLRRAHAHPARLTRTQTTCVHTRPSHGHIHYLCAHPALTHTHIYNLCARSALTHIHTTCTHTQPSSHTRIGPELTPSPHTHKTSVCTPSPHMGTRIPLVSTASPLHTHIYHLCAHPALTHTHTLPVLTPSPHTHTYTICVHTHPSHTHISLVLTPSPLHTHMYHLCSHSPHTHTHRLCSHTILTHTPTTSAHTQPKPPGLSLPVRVTRLTSHMPGPGQAASPDPALWKRLVLSTVPAPGPTVLRQGPQVARSYST